MDTQSTPRDLMYLLVWGYGVSICGICALYASEESAEKARKAEVKAVKGTRTPPWFDILEMEVL